MSHVEMPVYLVALRDQWASAGDRMMANAVPAFGTIEAARKYVRRIARRDGMPTSLYRIVEYAFSGKVMEG